MKKYMYSIYAMIALMPQGLFGGRLRSLNSSLPVSRPSCIDTGKIVPAPCDPKPMQWFIRDVCMRSGILVRIVRDGRECYNLCEKNKYIDATVLIEDAAIDASCTLEELVAFLRAHDQWNRALVFECLTEQCVRELPCTIQEMMPPWYVLEDTDTTFNMYSDDCVIIDAIEQACMHKTPSDRLQFFLSEFKELAKIKQEHEIVWQRRKAILQKCVDEEFFYESSHAYYPYRIPGERYASVRGGISADLRISDIELYHSLNDWVSQFSPSVELKEMLQAFGASAQIAE